VKKKYSISVISGSCGVKSHTIRAWEKRYHLFSPERSERGQRLYDDNDVIKARLLVSLIESGYSISSLVDYSIEELESMNHKIQSDASNIKKLNASAKLKVILDHMKDYRIDCVSDELQHARMSTGAREYILDLILPVIREVGHLVARGQYSVTQEHIISSIIRDQLSHIYLPGLGENKLNISLATPEGNLHEFSILLADILCRAHRLTTRYLGASHPALSLGEALNVFKPQVLVLGVLSSDKWDYEINMIPYLERVDAALTCDIIVILGGGFSIEFPEFVNIKEVKVLKTFEDFDKYLGGL